MLIKNLDNINNKIKNYVILVNNISNITIKKIEGLFNIKILSQIKSNILNHNQLNFYINDFNINLINVKDINYKDNIINFTKTFLNGKYNDLLIINNFDIKYSLHFLNNLYIFNVFKTEKNNSLPNTLYFYKHNQNEINLLNIYYENINFAKDLQNTPSNNLTPEIYSNIIKNITKNKNIKTQIFNLDQIKKMGMGAIVAIGESSKNSPRFVVLEYNGSQNKSETPIILIGKGVTFDSGGYNLKNGDFSDMKTDMTGSSIVLSMLLSAYKSNIKKNIVVILALVENAINNKPLRPGDIVKSYSGKTIEIIDTDAEGRLILADCLSYACKNYKPKYIIDFATLTGQANNIAGGVYSMIMGNNQKLINKLIKIGENVDDKLLQLPLDDIFIDNTKSSIANVKNYNYKYEAQSIMAGSFLSNFVDKKVKWVHIDIGGNFYNKSEMFVNGSCLKMAINFILN